MSNVFADMRKNIRELTSFDRARLEHIPMEVTEDDGSKLYWKELNGTLYIFDCI